MAKRWTLDGIESEGGEQQKRAGELKKEVEEHRERIKKLEESVEGLRTQQTELRGDGVEMAIGAIERAKQESKESIDKAREERDKLLKENGEMSEKVTRSFEDKKKSQQKLESLMRTAAGTVKGELQAAHDDLERDRNQLAFSDALLKEARLKLEAIDI
jgi:hypothetical protein